MYEHFHNYDDEDDKNHLFCIHIICITIRYNDKVFTFEIK